MYRNAIVSASITMFCILFMCVYATAAEMSILRAREIAENTVFQKALNDRVTKTIKMGASFYPPEDPASFSDFSLMLMKIWRSKQNGEIYADMCLKYSITRSGKHWIDSNTLFSIALKPYLNGQALDKVSDSDIFIKSSPAYTGTRMFTDVLTPLTDIEQKTQIGDRKISGAVSLGTFHFSEWESVDNSLAPDPVHKTLYDGSCFTVTYSDGSVVSYDLSYRPLFINGTLAKAGVKNTLVPLRFVAESLGGRVDWEASERRITLSIDTARARETVQMTIGSNCMYVSAMGWGTRELVNNFAPEIIDGRAYVPVYFLTERFAVPLTWESSGSSKLMVLAPGNIYIDFIEYNDNAIGMDDALQLLKETQTANFDMFQKERGPSNDSAQETVYKQIRQNITDTQLIGEITRYYIFESCGGTFYMDKITGDVFYQQREDLLVYSVVIYVPGIFTPFIHYFS